MGKKDKNKIYYCDGAYCSRCNEDVICRFKELIEESGASLSLKKMKCQGKCGGAPLFYFPQTKSYKKDVGEKKAEKIFNKILNRGKNDMR